MPKTFVTSKPKEILLQHNWQRVAILLAVMRSNANVILKNSIFDLLPHILNFCPPDPYACFSYDYARRNLAPSIPQETKMVDSCDLILATSQNVSADSKELNQLAGTASSKTPVIAKCGDRFFIYGAKKNGEWEVIELPSHAFDHVLFPTSSQPPIRLSSIYVSPKIMEEVIKRSGHYPLGYWVMNITNEFYTLYHNDPNRWKLIDCKDAGWKFHISVDDSDEENLAKAWDMVKDWMIFYQIKTCKVVRSGLRMFDPLKHNRKIYELHAGKQITLYACDEDNNRPEWPMILKGLNLNLTLIGIQSSYCPLFDRSLHGSTFFSFRNDAMHNGKAPKSDNGYENLIRGGYNPYGHPDWISRNIRIKQSVEQPTNLPDPGQRI